MFGLDTRLQSAIAARVEGIAWRYTYPNCRIMLLVNLTHSGQNKNGLTKRAPDVWESVRFTGIFLASGFFYISSIFHALPHAGNANRWLAGQRAKQKPFCACNCVVQ
jgi:hypothetical protein